MPANLEAKLDALTKRLERVEDELTLHRLIVSYGMAVDCGDITGALSCHTPDAEYIVSAARPGMADLVLKGHNAIADMLSGDLHQSLLPNSAHTIGPAIVDVKDNTYTAIGYSRLYHEGILMRIAVNQWHFQRAQDAWKIRRRVSRVVGEHAAQEILKSHFKNL